jgi:hypothetical protein
MMRNFRARSLLCFSLSCLCALSSSLASAAPPAHPGSDDDATVAMARERFKEGVGYFDQKQYDKARAAFMQAYALKKHPAVLLNLAQSELRSGHEADAAQHFAAYLRESKDASDAERQAAEGGLTAAKVVVAEVDVSIAEHGAEIYVDDALAGNAPLPGPLYLTPGVHAVEARKDGKVASTQVNAIAGKHLQADLVFAPKAKPKPATKSEPPAEPVAAPSPDVSPEPEPVPASSGGRKPFFSWLVSSPVGLVGLGLTGVGLGGGIGFALGSKKNYDSANSVASQIIQTAALDSGMAQPNTSSLCISPQAWLEGVHYAKSPPLAQRALQYQDACSKYQKDVHNGDTMKTVATVGFVVSGVAAVGTIVYYFVDPGARVSSDSARVNARRLALVPVLAPGERGLSLQGNF